MKIRHMMAALTAFLILCAPGAAHAYTETLPISPRAQQTPVWCWAASIEMVFTHYGVPNLNPAGNMQCGIVATLHPQCAYNCASCIVSGGTTANMAMSMQQYRVWVHQAGMYFPDIAFDLSGRLSFSDIADSIDQGNPMIAGISPSGMGQFYPPTMSEHAVVIIGYDDEMESVIVNDPYPYPYGADPYGRSGGRMLQPGRYEVRYREFVQILGYKDTIVFFS